MPAVKSIVLGALCLVAYMGWATPQFRSTMTISGYAGSSELVDFPVLVKISPELIPGFRYADCATGGADVSFASADGATVYPHEIDTWNPDGESLVWVKIPSLSGKTTQFVMNWRDANPPANDPTDTWGEKYGMVWHMGEAGGTCANATKNGSTYDAVPAGDTAQSVAYAEGAIGAGRTTASSATPSYLSVASYDDLAYGNSFTISGWFRQTDASGTRIAVLDRKGTWNANDGWRFEFTADGFTGGTARGAKNAGGGFTTLPRDREWVHLTLSFNNTSVAAYGNGVKGGAIGIYAATDNALPLLIGYSE